MNARNINERRHTFSQALQRHSLYKLTRDEIAKINLPMMEVQAAS